MAKVTSMSAHKCRPVALVNSNSSASATTRLLLFRMTPISPASSIGTLTRAPLRAVFVDATGKLGTVAVNVIGNKGAPQAVPQRVQPHAIGQDPKQAMLNRKVEKQQATIAELKSTIAQQQKQIEKQQKQMDIVTARLKAQAAQIQEVSAQIQLSRPAPRTVANGD